MTHEKPFHPVIQEFQNFIESSPSIREALEGMFLQVPTKPPYDLDTIGRPQLRNYMSMLTAFNLNLSKAPEYNGKEVGALPLSSMFYWTRRTKSGNAVFHDSQVNCMLKRMFDVWAQFLTSHESCYVLTTDEYGWFGPAGRAKMPRFSEEYICNPSAPHYGFTSWDDFFTRRFQPGKRPVAFENDSTVVTNACESTVYRIAYNVKEKDTFWLKGDPYSLHHMLGGDPLAQLFAGGTVFQSYLGITDYHRWHSPVSGMVQKIVNIPGTYFAESPANGFIGNEGYTPARMNQAYISAVATRMLIFIDADNPKIGLMCFMAIGMVEVSTCEATVKVGQKVKKGEETGMFHLGGSTYCVIFRPETNISFSPKCQVGEKISLNSAIAIVA